MGLTLEAATVAREWPAAAVPASRRTPGELRRAFTEAATRFTREPVAWVTDRTITTELVQLPIRIYRPAGTVAAPPGAGCAVLVWFHGGGWTVGNLDLADAPCCALANRAGAVVVSVGYRLAPEHPFPAAVHDAETAVRWVAANAHALGVDPGRLAVGGDSAGGNLAAVVCQQLRGSGPPVRFQLLVYPVTDGRLTSASMIDNADGYGLTRDEMEWYWRQYVGDRSREDPRMSPLCAPVDALTGLPPALVITAELDPLRDEGEAYGRRLREAGTACEIARYRGMVHGFFSLVGLVPAATTAICHAANSLQEVVTTERTSQ